MLVSFDNRNNYLNSNHASLLYKTMESQMYAYFSEMYKIFGCRDNTVTILHITKEERVIKVTASILQRFNNYFLQMIYLWFLLEDLYQKNRLNQTTTSSIPYGRNHFMEIWHSILNQFRITLFRRAKQIYLLTFDWGDSICLYYIMASYKKIFQLSNKDSTIRLRPEIVFQNTHDTTYELLKCYHLTIFHITSNLLSGFS